MKGYSKKKYILYYSRYWIKYFKRGRLVANSIEGITKLLRQIEKVEKDRKTKHKQV